ncbi:TonB-dependent receptor, partial [candidate division KSB1 bacterium]|nr:TonB-dependent receptor [candidate division KSB1 bacterium]
MRRLSHFMLFSFITLTVSAGQFTGSIKGQVVESDTKAPLPGANVSILNSTLGAAADNQGFFVIADVPAGSYSLQFQFIGYQKVVKTDVIVKSNRVTTVNAELRFAVVEMQGITVTGGYFSETDAQAVSAINFSNEEIRRSAGSHGDVSRIIAVLPSVAPSTDQTNNLVVRGGNPGENAFYVDNIQIPNINHFPTEGSAGGALGILNVDFIEDVDFYAGGFSSAYGDRLSSVMDITFREGSRERLAGQVDLNWAGFGFVGEGPLARQKGAWLFSARKSYLDMVVRAIDVGNSIAPRYGDYQGKIVYDINQNHKLSLLAVWSEDANRADKQTAIENDMVVFMNQDIRQNTTGVNWRALWSVNGYSNTSFAHTMERFDEEAFDTGTEDLLMDNDSRHHLFALRNSNHFRLGPSGFIDFGFDGKLAIAQFHNFYGEQIDPAGQPLPPLRVENKSRATLMGGFFDYSLSPVEKMTIRLGCRVDHSSMNGNVQLAPRSEFLFRLSPLTMLQASAGLYYQQLPIELLSKNKDLAQLKSTRAAHFILGVSHLLTESTKFTCELYR